MLVPNRWDVVREVYRSRIGNSIKGLFAILVAGTLGYYFMGLLHEKHLFGEPLPAGSHWSLMDCLYFTTITLTTVGYGETLEPAGLQAFPDVRLYTIGLLLLAMIATAYFISSATAFFVEGDLKKFLERRRMLLTLSSLQGHFIICGSGQTGRHIAEELLASKKECVVIDADAKNVAALHEQVGRVHSLIGDATKDETLLDAGIERASGLAAVLSDDKDNLFLTISARQLNKGLRIISRAVDMPTRAKLLKAGADSVVASNYIGGLRIASELVRPAVVSFLDQMLRSKTSPVRFSEVKTGPAAAGKTLRELDIPKRVGLVIIALKNPGQDGFVYNPGPDVPVVSGATLVVMGETERVTKLEVLVGAGEHVKVVQANTIEMRAVDIDEQGNLKDPRDNL